MALQVEINSTIVADTALHVMADFQLAAVSPVYPFETFVLRNTGGSTMTVDSITAATWGRNIAVSGISLPATLTAGATATGIISVVARGITDLVPVHGTPFQRITVAYTVSGQDQASVYVEVAAKITKATPNTGYTFPTQTAFASTWVVDFWALANGDRTVDNPGCFGFGIFSNGHMYFALNQLKFSLDAGHKAWGAWVPYGQFLDLADPTNIQLDQKLHAQEYGVVLNNAHGWDQVEQMLDFAFSYADTKAWFYLGNDRTDTNFTTPIASHDPTAFMQRALLSVQPFWHRSNMGIIFDDPYDAAVVTGEARQAHYEVCRALTGRRGGICYTEPRPPSSQTFWHGAAGWNHFMQDATYTRTNPAWNTDTGPVATDAQLGTIARWVTNGSAQLLPYQIVDTLLRGHQCFIGIGFLWYVQGGTLASIYAACKALADYAEGSTES